MADQNTNPVSFVRTEMLPEQDPPATQTGIIKWMRENLFSSIPNTVLTLLSFYAIYLILAPSLPWLLNGVWNANSLAQCREILDGKSGACFAVISERWTQLLFGIAYPSELYWRPTLAFVLLFIAMAPVLFFDLPRKLLIFTALYPFIAFYLIWGGTILSPLLALAGFIVGGLVYQRIVASSFATGFFGGVIAAKALTVARLAGVVLTAGATWARTAGGASQILAARNLLTAARDG